MRYMVFAIGDVHGQYWRLVELLAKLPLQDEDQIVFVGDYIDRGPASSEVIQLLIELKAARPNTIFLRGNHEQMMLDARSYKDRYQYTALWFGNGGAETVDSYPRGTGWIERVPSEHWKFIEETIFEYWLGAYAFVHAGFLPKGAKWPHDEDPRLWIREPFIYSKFDFGARVIFGHTPQKTGEPLVKKNKIGIDTAAAYGGPLTAVELDPSGAKDPIFYKC
ncbi:metallophosphoesterase family protein [soil metagenome]